MGYREWRERQIAKSDERVARADARAAAMKEKAASAKVSRDGDLLNEWYVASAAARGVDHEVMASESARFGVPLPEPRKKWLVERARNKVAYSAGVVPVLGAAAVMGGGVNADSSSDVDAYDLWLHVVRAEMRCAEYVARGEQVPTVERGTLRSARFMYAQRGWLNTARSAIMSVPM